MQSRLTDIRSIRFGLALAVLVLTSLLLPASVLARDDEASEGESDEQSKASEEEETKEPEPEPDADDLGNRKRRWPVEQVMGRGHGLAMAYYGRFSPTCRPGGCQGQCLSAFRGGVGHQLVRRRVGLDPRIDNDHVIVMGRSRLGQEK